MRKILRLLSFNEILHFKDLKWKKLEDAFVRITRNLFHKFVTVI